MKTNDRIIDVLKKYRLHAPLPSSVQKRIRPAQRKALAAIIRSEQKDSVFVAGIVGIYYRLRNLGLRLTLPQAYRLTVGAASFAVIVLVAAAGVTIGNAVIDARFLEGVEGIVMAVSGDARITGPDGGVRPATTGDCVRAGDAVTTADDAFAQIQVADTTLMRIVSGTRVKMNSLYERRDTVVSLESGSLLSRLDRLKTGHSYEVKTPNARVIVTGTVFSVRYAAQRTVVVMREGAARIIRTAGQSGAPDERTVRQGSTAVVSDTISVRNTSDEEGALLESFAATPLVANPSAMNAGEREAYRHREAERIADAERTLRSLRERADRDATDFINEIHLFDGRVIRGAILSRGAVCRIRTDRGIIEVPQGKIKHVRVIK